MTNQVNNQRHKYHPLTAHYHNDSEDDDRSGCRNVSHCHQQFFSELHSPGRSRYTNYFVSRVVNFKNLSVNANKRSWPLRHGTWQCLRLHRDPFGQHQGLIFGAGQRIAASDLGTRMLRTYKPTRPPWRCPSEQITELKEPAPHSTIPLRIQDRGCTANLVERMISRNWACISGCSVPRSGYRVSLLKINQHN